MDKGFFCDQGQFYYGNKMNSNNPTFACLGESPVTINADNRDSTVF